MIVYKLDENNDIFLDTYGNIAQADSPISLNQSIGNLLQMWLGEAIYNEEQGIDWYNYLNEPYLPLALKKKQIETQIYDKYPQVQITNLTLSLNGVTRDLSLDLEYEYNGEVYNVSI